MDIIGALKSEVEPAVAVKIAMGVAGGGMPGGLPGGMPGGMKLFDEQDTTTKTLFFVIGTNLLYKI